MTVSLLSYLIIAVTLGSLGLRFSFYAEFQRFSFDDLSEKVSFDSSTLSSESLSLIEEPLLDSEEDLAVEFGWGS